MSVKNFTKKELDEAIALFPTSPEWLQIDLIKKFGQKHFLLKITARIKTFNDVCLSINTTEKVFDEKYKKLGLPIDTVAYEKLKLIIQVLNEGWTPDWNNQSQQKWYVWFKLSSGFGFDRTSYYYDYTYTSVGSLLCFKSDELATYAATQFTEIYKQFLV